MGLMLKVKKGDISAFDEIVRRHKRSLINFFYKFLWDRQLAEDSSQEVFCRLFMAAKRYKPYAKFNTFLYRIAMHCVSDQVRERKKNPKAVSLDQKPAGEGSKSTDLHEKVASQGAGPREQLEKRELRDAIRRAILSLPLKQRRVFVLCEDQGLTYKDAAGVLRIPVGTVKSRMYKATRLLREELKGIREG